MAHTEDELDKTGNPCKSRVASVTFDTHLLKIKYNFIKPSPISRKSE